MGSTYPFIHDSVARPKWVGSIDARIRIFAGLVAVVLISILLKPTPYLVLSTTLVVLLIALKVTQKDLRRLFLFLLPMAAITLALHLLFNRSGHTPIGSILGLSISREALDSGLMFCWRLALFLGAAQVATLMISANDFALGIWRLLSPLQFVNSAINGIGMALWVAIRFIPEIFAQYHQIEFAQKARGATFGGGLVSRVRSVVPLLIPVTASAIRKSDVLGDALTVRGWGVCKRRSFYNNRPLRWLDYAFLVMTLAWGAVILRVGL